MLIIATLVFHPVRLTQASVSLGIVGVRLKCPLEEEDGLLDVLGLVVVLQAIGPFGLFWSVQVFVGQLYPAQYRWLGAFYYHRARYPEAVEMFKHVVELVPDSFRGYSNLGAAYMGEGRYVEAIPNYQRSLTIRPTALGYSNLGTSYFFLRRYEEAALAYEQVITLNDDDNKEYDYLFWWNLGDGYYWAPGKRGQATNAYRHAISVGEQKLQVNPKNADVLGVLAVCSAMLNEKKPALEYLRRGLQLAPDDPDLRYKAALVHSQFGEADQALAWLEKALSAGYSPRIVRDTPNFDLLHADRRYTVLLQKAGLPP